jgi:hypothetical protein
VNKKKNMEPTNKRKGKSKGNTYILQWSVNNCVKSRVAWRRLIHQGKHLINIAHFSNTDVHSSRQALKLLPIYPLYH